MRDVSAPLEAVVGSYLRSMRSERRLGKRTQDLYQLHFSQYGRWLQTVGRDAVLADIDADVVRSYLDWRPNTGSRAPDRRIRLV